MDRLGHPLVCDHHVSLIDPNIFTEPNGWHFLYYKTDNNGLQPQEATIIYGHELRSDGVGFVGHRHRLIKNTLGWQGDVVEAWVMQRGHYDFMFYSGFRYCNATYGVGVARATSPLGPFRKRSAPILHSNGTWVGPGHIDRRERRSRLHRLSRVARCGAVAGRSSTRALRVAACTPRRPYPLSLGYPGAFEKSERQRRCRCADVAPYALVTVLPARLTRIILLAAVVVGVGVDVFFAVVNFYPVAPHPNPGPKRYVVMQLDEVQAAWFQHNILEDFNAETNSNLEVLRVSEEEQLQAIAHDAAAAGKDVVLVALPETQLGHAITTKLVRPFSDTTAPDRIAADFSDLGAAVLAPGRVADKQFFLPRMAVVDVAAYRVSKVRDAVSHWSVLRPQINATLAKINGRGLPAGYELGLTPSAWTSYDLFVMAYYWSHRSYGGEPARPRVAHRTGDEIDGQRDIVSALYRLGATDTTVRQTENRAAIDFFQWESLYRDEGAYVPEMFEDDPFDDEAVLDGLRSGDLFFAPIDTMEAFNLHGGSHAGAFARIDDPADLEFTSMPRGASLALDANGHPQRHRPSFSFLENWVWALPAATSSPAGYQLVKFLWRPEIHARECEALGMLPLHPQIVTDRVSRFRLDWMSHVFEAGLEQARYGEQTPPLLIDQGVGSVYAQLWTNIVIGKMPSSPDTEIVAALHAPPKPKPLAVRAKGDAEPAKPDKPAPDPAIAAAENQDWETDAVLERVVGAKP